ncbi:(Fe-S)-binding protein [Lederbergia lenta]|uniref:Glycolate oxidase iron-sulfur subunit n=1 Tax=Lederbergia lenta TaxID=1467 RepID=A0A2X4WSX8_LEDLE|nr:(Fe-S)-binding protein [Lederbergia lenta]MCM3112980.1 (Fe-S)-binding protein [Lederbergia lenta]MEC2326630.1 (Fe-S)-binding protein [Lederbergia lenta]SQI61642.1 glycolate oxidase iron-sulfur subunit [Lederbergia lenta]
MIATEESKKIQQQFAEKMDMDELLNCMRCGFCLPACPTYIETNFQEKHSPRGRIALMKAVADGMIEFDDDVEESLDLCLGCRACEPACPAGVNYGMLLEDARDIISQNKKHSVSVKAVRNTVFEGLFPHQNRMVNLTGLLGFYQRSGLQKTVRKIGFMKLFPENLAQMERVLPEVPKKNEMKERPDFLQANTVKTKTVAFFSGCLMDTMFMKTNDATLELLQMAGCDVVIPKSQGCCGALHGHSGEKAKAIELAKKNIAAFEDTNADYIVTNAGGCGGFLIGYDHLLADDFEWNERAKVFTQKLRDISQILYELDFHREYSLCLPGAIFTYQDSCHLRNVMHTAAAPRQLLNAITNAEFREMPEADRCCGSAGIYNIVEPEMSMQILDHKMEHVESVQPGIIVTANPGCLLQMKLGIERAGLQGKVEAFHIADVLLKAAKSEINPKR